MGGARFCFLTKNTSAVGQWSPLGLFPCSNDVVRVASGLRTASASGFPPAFQPLSRVNASGRRHRRRASLCCQASDPREPRWDSNRAKTPKSVFFLVHPFAAVLVRGSFPKFPASARPTERPPEDHPCPKAATNAKCNGTSRVARRRAHRSERDQEVICQFCHAQIEGPGPLLKARRCSHWTEVQRTFASGLGKDLSVLSCLHWSPQEAGDGEVQTSARLAASTDEYGVSLRDSHMPAVPALADRNRVRNITGSDPAGWQVSTSRRGRHPETPSPPHIRSPYGIKADFCCREDECCMSASSFLSEASSKSRQTLRRRFRKQG